MKSICRPMCILLPLLAASITVTARANNMLLTQALDRHSAHMSTDWSYTQTTTVQSKSHETEKHVEYFYPLKFGHGNAQKIVTYSDIKHIIGADTQLMERTSEHSVYAIRTTNLPPIDLSSAGSHMKIDGDWSENALIGTVEVVHDAKERSYVKDLQLHLEKPFSSHFARIKKIDMRYPFEPALAENVMLMNAFSVDVDMRALIFMRQKAKVDVVFTNFLPMAGSETAYVDR